MSKKTLCLALLFLFILQACKHEIIVEVKEENEEQLETPDPEEDPDVPEKICDTDTVYFKQDILPLLVSSCAMTGCHNTASAKEDIILESYDDILNPQKYTIVIPGNPNKSELYKSLFGDPSYGYYDEDDIMPPPPYNPLEDEDKIAIRTWILQGAKNNSCEASECLTDGLTYENEIKKIVDKHCVGCHNTTNPLGDVLLETYAQVKLSIDSESFMNTIHYKPNYAAMPPSYQLSSCDIDKLEQWIEKELPQ